MPVPDWVQWEAQQRQPPPGGMMPPGFVASIPPDVVAAAGGQPPPQMSVAEPTPPAPMSSLNYTPAQPSAESPIPAQEAAQPAPEPNSPMAAWIASAARGNQQVVPGGFRQTGFQVEQAIPSAMPGTDVNPTVPAMMTSGVERVPMSVLAALNAPRSNPDDESTYVPQMPEGTNPQAWAAMSPVEQRQFVEYSGGNQQIPRGIDPQKWLEMTPSEQREASGFSGAVQAPYVNPRTAYAQRLLNETPEQLSPTGEPLRPETDYQRAQRAADERQNQTKLGQEQIQEDKLKALEHEEIRQGIDATVWDMRAQEIADDQKRRQAFVAEHLPRLEAMMDERANFEAKNPTTEYFKSLGPVGHIATMIGLGLGSIGSGLTGAPNDALALVNRGIDGEFAKQRAMAETLGTKFHQARTLYGDMLNQFMDPQAAEDATRYALGMSSASELRRLAAKSQGIDEKARYNALADQVEQQAADKRANAVTGLQKTLWQNVPAKVVGQPGGPLALAEKYIKAGVPKEQALPLAAKTWSEGPQAAARAIQDIKPTQNRSQLEGTKYERATRVVLPDRFASMIGSREITATDPEQKKDLQQMARNGSLLLDSVDRLQRIAEKGTRISPTDRAFVEMEAAKSMGQWRVTLGLGVMSESDKELVEPLSGKFVNSFSLRDRMEMLGKLRADIVSQTMTALKEGYIDRSASQPAVPPIRSGGAL